MLANVQENQGYNYRTSEKPVYKTPLLWQFWSPSNAQPIDRNIPQSDPTPFAVVSIPHPCSDAADGSTSYERSLGNVVGW